MYVASDHPYSYTDLYNCIKEVCTEEAKKIVTKTTLCKTIAGNECPILTVTNFSSSKEEIEKRETIVFTARVHPGYIFAFKHREVNGSMVMEGIVRYLIGLSEQAKQLRNLYVFKLIPMLNPDGVIIGNYRCSLAGHDLNRRWRDPLKHLFPEIYATKDVRG
jgi:murein tripeptide amidase MpaA